MVAILKSNSHWLSTAQVAAELGLASSTLRHWRKIAFGPKAVLCGRQFRYRRSDVDAWLASRPVMGEEM